MRVKSNQRTSKGRSILKILAFFLVAGDELVGFLLVVLNEIRGIGTVCFVKVESHVESKNQIKSADLVVVEKITLVDIRSPAMTDNLFTRRKR